MARPDGKWTRAMARSAVGNPSREKDQDDIWNVKRRERAVAHFDAPVRPQNGKAGAIRKEAIRGVVGEGGVWK